MKVLLSKKIKEIDEEATYSEVMRDINRVKVIEINIVRRGQSNNEDKLKRES